MCRYNLRKFLKNYLFYYNYPKYIIDKILKFCYTLDVYCDVFEEFIKYKIIKLNKELFK